MQRRPQRAQRNYTPLVEPLSVVFPKVASLLRLLEVHPPPSPLSHWYNTNLYCNFHRVVGHSTDSCYILRNAIQDLIDRKVIVIDTQEAASTPVPPPAPGFAPQHPNIVNQPLPPHSSSGGTGPSGVHCVFPSKHATSVVDPLSLIHHISEPFPAHLFQSALASFELAIHMIRLTIESERTTAPSTTSSQAQPPIRLST